MFLLEKTWHFKAKMPCYSRMPTIGTSNCILGKGKPFHNWWLPIGHVGISTIRVQYPPGFYVSIVITSVWQFPHPRPSLQLKSLWDIFLQECPLDPKFGDNAPPKGTSGVLHEPNGDYFSDRQTGHQNHSKLHLCYYTSFTTYCVPNDIFLFPAA